MIKMQMKYKDSKLRAINKGLGDAKIMEEIKLGDTDFKRSRVISNYQNGPTRSRDL